MEQERLDDVNELRFRQLERLNSILIEGQHETARLLTENTKQLIQVNRRLDKVEQRLDKVEERLDKMERRLDKVELRLDGMDLRLQSVENRLESLEKQSGQMMELLTLALADLSFIKEILKPGK